MDTRADRGRSAHRGDNLAGAVWLVASVCLCVTACGKSDSKPKPGEAERDDPPAKTEPPRTTGDTRTPPRNVPPFKPEYGPRFVTVMKALGAAVAGAKGDCDAIAAAAGAVIDKHADTIELMRDTSSPAARAWRVSSKADVVQFREDMKPMVACSKHAGVKVLLRRMRRGH